MHTEPMNEAEEQLFQYIGQRLRERRQAIDVTQADLAQRLGILRSSLANIESGRQRVPLITLYRLCFELNSDLTSMLPSVDTIVPRNTIVVTPESAPPKTLAIINRLLDNSSE